MELEQSKYEILEIETKRKTFRFSIKKVYSQKYLAYNDKLLLLESALLIYYEVMPEKINEIRRPPWSIKWEPDPSDVMRRDTSKSKGKIKYGYRGIFEISKEYRNIGLGSYLLDSLTLWAQENFNQAIVYIHIVDDLYDDVEASMIEHFYGKRKLKDRARISELKTFISEADNIRAIPAADYVLSLYKDNNALSRNLDKAVFYNSELGKIIARDEAKYKLLVAILILTLFFLAWCLKDKIG